MIDVIHFVILFTALVMIGVGLWMVHPSAMFVGVGSILMLIVIASRVRVGRRRPVE